MAKCIGRFVFIALILVLAVSVFGQTKTSDVRIEIKNSQFYLSSKLVKLPITANELEKIIGKPDRSLEGVNKVSTWDKLGLVGYQKLGSDDYHEIGIVLDVKENKFEFNPSNTFQGSFIIDGVRVTPASSLNSLNQGKKGAKFKPIPFVKILSEYRSGNVYMVMWQTEKAKVIGDAKILQISISKAEAK
ncbi:MAG: hypothetical protein WBO10_10380 [Pyrinomonadaceae bacterium]